MKLTPLVCAGIATTLLAAPAFAHGGQYRGPGDIVPPHKGGAGGRSPGTSSPGTGGPRGPTTPTPGGGTTGGPTTGGRFGGPGIGGPITGGAQPIDIRDLSLWQFWWEFNKDPFLQLKAKIHRGLAVTGPYDYIMGRGQKSDVCETLAPSQTDLVGTVIPALKQALQDPDSSRDIVSSCMIALARVGLDPTMLPLFKRFLADSDQEKAETAALAMGIAALPEAMPELLALAQDTPAGRRLTKSPGGVHFRSRSFACYGLGLIAHRTTDLGIKRSVFDVMRQVLDSDRRSRRDIQVAALHAIRLLNPNPSKEEGRRLQEEAVAYLMAFLDMDEVFEQIRAHAYQAVARLVGRNDSSAPLKTRFLEAVASRRESHWIHQSAILALGEMANPDDTAVSKALETYLEEGKDQQAQYFAAIALGQIGGEHNRGALRRRLVRTSTKSILKPWLALGLGLADYAAREADKSREIDSTAIDIRRQFDQTRSPAFAAGLAIALGVMRSRDAGDTLLDRMLEYKNNDEAGGYVAVALGLMGHQEAKEPIQHLLDKATRRPDLLTKCAIALGLLGDKDIGLRLIEHLKAHEERNVAVFSALAQALGFIGDRRVIADLVALLGDKKLQPLNRAFAAVALGLVGDKEMLPWNSKISIGINYRASVDTLTGSGSGILDIL